MSRPPGLNAAAVAAFAQGAAERITPRLRLRQVALGDAELLADSLNASLPALRFIHWAQQPVSLEWAQRFCARGVKFVEDGECLIYHVFERDSGRYVGRIDLHTFDFDAPRCEIGYVGDSRMAGRGLMREAVLETTAVAFEMGVVRVQALSDARNERAQVFARSLGFRREGELHAYERDPWGELATQVMYAAFPPDLAPAGATDSSL